MENTDQIAAEFLASNLPPSDPEFDGEEDGPFFDVEEEAMSAWRLRDLLAATFGA